MKQAIWVTGGLAASLAAAGCASPSRSQGSDEGVRASDGDAAAALCASVEAAAPASASSAGGDASALPAAVAAQPVAASAEKWKFSATPFMWFAGMDTRVSAKGQSASANMSFGDVWDNLDMAAMAHIEANKGKWSIFAEGVWTELTDEGTGPAGGDVRVTVKELIAGAYGAYQIVETKFADSRNPNDASVLTLDLYGGTRYTLMKGEINPENAGSARDDMSWWDPVVGLRGRMAVTPEFALVMRGDTGGWHHDDASWYFMAGVDWDVCGYATVGFGYAVLTSKYRDGSDSDDFAIKQKLSGPLVSVTIRF